MELLHLHSNENKSCYFLVTILFYAILLNNIIGTFQGLIQQGVMENGIAIYCVQHNQHAKQTNDTHTKIKIFENFKIRYSEI